jgi:hypothetical protein
MQFRWYDRDQACTAPPLERQAAVNMATAVQSRNVIPLTISVLFHAHISVSAMEKENVFSREERKQKCNEAIRAHSYRNLHRSQVCKFDADDDVCIRGESSFPDRVYRISARHTYSGVHQPWSAHKSGNIHQRHPRVLRAGFDIGRNCRNLQTYRGALSCRRIGIAVLSRTVMLLPGICDCFSPALPHDGRSGVASRAAKSMSALCIMIGVAPTPLNPDIFSMLASSGLCEVL